MRGKFWSWIFGPHAFGEFKLWKGFSPRTEVEVMNGKSFSVADYSWRSKNLSSGILFTSEGRGGNTAENPTLNPFSFGSVYKERTNSFSPLLGIPSGSVSDVGILYQIGKTQFFKNQ